MSLSYLCIFRRKTIQTFLNDMVTIQVLNQFNDPIFESVNDCLNLTASQVLITLEITAVKLTCSGVEMNSIIFWRARVPC